MNKKTKPLGTIGIAPSWNCTHREEIIFLELRGALTLRGPIPTGVLTILNSSNLYLNKHKKLFKFRGCNYLYKFL